jgi:hypothetical protein
LAGLLGRGDAVHGYPSAGRARSLKRECATWAGTELIMNVVQDVPLMIPIRASVSRRTSRTRHCDRLSPAGDSVVSNHIDHKDRQLCLQDVQTVQTHHVRV